jgi:cytochrome c peroxidase
MAHVIQLASCAFMSNLSVNGRTTCLESHECNQQFGENEPIKNGKSQRLQIDGNASINMASAMRAGVAKIMENVHTSRYFESTETALQTAENG